jgi:hypothetical protein
MTHRIYPLLDGESNALADLLVSKGELLAQVT